MVISLIPALSQACAGGGSGTIQIDFSNDPEGLTGSQVFVDGEAAREIRPEGGSTVVTFQVSPGPHTLELRKEGYESQPIELAAIARGETMTLKAESATWFTDGQLKNALTLSR